MITVSGSALISIWKAPWIGHYITITDSTPSISFDAALYKTDLYEMQSFTGALAEFNDGVSWFKYSCALVHLKGDIPSELAIRVDLTVLKDGESILIPWKFTAMSVSYWRNPSGLHISVYETFIQDEDGAIPDKDHVVVIPSIPSYQASLGDAPGEVNAIIIEFDFSNMVDAGEYSIDIELEILGSG